MQKIFILTLLFVSNFSALFAQKPPVLTANAPDFNFALSIADNFNAARRFEETNLGLTAGALGSMTLPTYYASLPMAQKALLLINAERTCRNGVNYGTGALVVVPLQGIESHLSDIGKAHVDWLIAQNKYEHCGNPIFGTGCSAAFSSPTQRVQGNATLVDGWERNNENLGLATASDSASSFILMIHEYTIFNLLYRDASVTWGHRNNLLQALIDNFGPQGSEGFLGVAETFAAGYNPFNRANTNFGKVVAYEIYDPAQGATNAFSVTDVIKLDTVPTNKLFRLVSKSNGRPLSIAKSLTVAGAAIVQDSMADLASQKWRMDSTSNGYVKFVSVLTGQAIDVRWGGKRQGIRINQWTSSASSSQEWKIEPQTDGSVKLINRNSSLALSVPNAPTKGNQQAVQLKNAPFYNQSFQLVPTN